MKNSVRIWFKGSNCSFDQKVRKFQGPSFACQGVKDGTLKITMYNSCRKCS